MLVRKNVSVHLGAMKGVMPAAASTLVALAGRAQCMCAGKGWVTLGGGSWRGWWEALVVVVAWSRGQGSWSVERGV